MKAGHGEISGRNWGWWAKTDVDGSIHAVENVAAECATLKCISNADKVVANCLPSYFFFFFFFFFLFNFFFFLYIYK